MDQFDHEFFKAEKNIKRGMKAVFIMAIIQIMIMLGVLIFFLWAVYKLLQFFGVIG